jgi:two-component system vancomycin resistance associated response regulator VraR
MQLNLDALQMVVNLTPSEVRVLRKLILGLTNDEIAISIGSTRRTVQAHMTNMLNKTEFSNRTALALWAYQQPEIRQ